MFGRPSRRELAAQVRERQERIDALESAARPPRWRRALARFNRGPWWWRLFVTWPAAVAGVGAAAGALLAVAVARAWLRWPRGTTATAAGAWTFAGGPGGWWGVLPLSLTTVAAVWWHYRLRPLPPPPLPPPVHGHVALWRQRVADGDDAPARGAHVSDLVTVVRAPDGRACGVTLHVTGADSTQTPVHMGRIIDRLTWIYGVDAAAITVHPVKGNNRRSDITILDQWWMDDLAEARRARVHEVQPWTGPSLEPDGRFRVMTAQQDGQPVYGRLWTPGHGAHDIDLSGVKGSGKSNAAHLILASVMSAGRVVLDLIDLKGGTSLPEWRAVAHRFGSTVDEAMTALDRATAVMQARLAEYARTPRLDADGNPVVVHGQPLVGVSQRDPSEDFPVYLLVIDEFPELIANRDAERKLRTLVNQSRSTNVAVMLIHQSNNRGDGWGDNTGIRTNITKSGTVVAFRNDAGAGSKSVGGTARLQDIEEGTPGAGFVSSPCTRGEVFGRVEFVADVVEALRLCRPGRLEVAAEGAVAEVEAWAEESRRRRDAARDAAKAAAAAVPVASGAVGSVPVMAHHAAEALAGPGPDPAASDRIVAYLASQGAGRVLKTGEILAGAGVRSSTFTQWRLRQPEGFVIDHGHGRWAAGAALVMDRSNA